MRTTRTPPQMCPNCGYVFDAATEAIKAKAKPKPGDVSLCLNCINVGIYNADLSVRSATDAEIADLDAGTKKLIAQAKIARASAPFGNLARRGSRA
jgi:hypothetical protein